MSYRYAILWELADSAQPIGLALERERDVLVVLPEVYGLPANYSHEYRVLQPDLTEIVYRVGDEGYLDHVLIELQRHFAVQGSGVVESCDDVSVCTLMQDHVWSPRTRRRKSEYQVGVQAESADLFVQACLAPRMHGTQTLLPIDSAGPGGASRRRVPQVA